MMTACRNRALNVARDSGRARQALASWEPLLAARPPDGAGPDGADPGSIADDRLRLIVMCCHPLLSADAQVALTLRMVGGLSTEEIARGFHRPPAVIAQRIVRAKRTLRERPAEFAVAEKDATARLPAILDVIYLVFNEGYLPASGETLTRGDLALEAYRLATLLTELVPARPQPWALRALIAFPLSRWATRTGEDGLPLTLDEQDRSRWNRELIADGAAALERARRGERGALLIQAELAACHATAPSFEATDWPAIVACYDELLVLQDTAVVALNRAVAVAMADGPGAALPLLDELVTDPALRASHRAWAVRADLHRRRGDAAAAIADYDRAIELAGNEAERRYLAAARSRMAGQVPAHAPGREQERDATR